MKGITVIYWLFHEYQHIALIPAIVSSAAAVVSLILYLIFAGSSIRTSAELGRGDRRLMLLRSLNTLSISIAIISLFCLFLGASAIDRPRSPQQPNAILEALVAPITVDQRRAIGFGVFMLAAVIIVNGLVIWQTRRGSFIRLWLDNLRGLRSPEGSHGSAHFATKQEYRRFVKEQEGGVNLYGKFMGERRNGKFTYLGDLFALEAEDAARGIITIGNPGSGKSSSVILPMLYDCMRYGQNLVVADPQQELSKHIIRYAAIFGYRVIIHDPTDEKTPRYNLAEGIKGVTRAKAVGEVLVPKNAGGGEDFWSKAAEALLGACLIRFDNVGEIFSAFTDIKQLGQRLNEKADDAQKLAASFISSALGDQKLAGNVVATLQVSLQAWADDQIRQSTATSDFSAAMLVDEKQPTVLILACSGQYRRVVAPYLGAVLTKILLELDAIGEKTETGALPTPIKFVIDEFPALGDLSSIVEQANLVRKRRIAFMLALQTLGQLEGIYGRNGMETLLAGMAFQVIFGGSDKATAEHYSRQAGDTTETEVDKETGRKHSRSRALLTADEVVRPPQGNAIIFGRYVTADFATYVVVLTRLTRIYERADVERRVKAVDPRRAMLMQRGEGEGSRAEDKAAQNPEPASIPTASTIASNGRENKAQTAITQVAAAKPMPRNIKPLCSPDEWRDAS